MAEEARSAPAAGGAGHPTVVRAAVAAAATGAAAYGVQRMLASRHDDGPTADDASSTEDERADEGDRRGASGKREELTQALSSKAAEAKQAAARLKPGGKPSVIETAWESASPHLLPVAREAASSLGASVAKKSPDVVREQLMPRFIEGFEKAS